MNLTVKALKNRLGEYGIYWGVDGKATKLAYLRFFRNKDIAEKWVEKFRNKMLKK